MQMIQTKLSYTFISNPHSSATATRTQQSFVKDKQVLTQLLTAAITLKKVSCLIYGQKFVLVWPD